MNTINKRIKLGDVVFISIPNVLYRKVAATTKSWTSHVGFVHSFKDGEWQIAESAVPTCTITPLSKFIDRSENGMFAVRRLKEPLNEEAISKLQKAAESRMGRLYHFGFKLHSKRQFCSKFVYQVYKEALNIEVGSVTTFRELLQTNPEAPLTFWRLWYFGFIPWKRMTITPASQLRCPKLETVFEKIQ
ncbi:MAG: YebB family permuted papain-like enzyme [Lentisphaerales bacterium]|nr:YebB family permuted papain-like enzyme [Lentisphaerales bacterium]